MTDTTVRVFVESEAGSNVRRVFDETTLELRSERRVSAAYPFPYGFILGTITDDGIAVDCFVLTAERIRSGTTVRGPVDLDFASALLGVSLDAILSNALPPARSKALLAQLIEEVRVVSGQDVRVTYRVPPEVRIPDGIVVRTSQYANQPTGVVSRLLPL